MYTKQVFFFSHLLYVPYFLFLILHSNKFWLFFAVPGSLFLAEKISMMRCVRKARLGEMYIKEVVLWPSGVTQAVLNHPANFTFKPGDYCFLNIPSVAQFEWHPFTISSAPENSRKCFQYFHAPFPTLTLNAYAASI